MTGETYARSGSLRVSYAADGALYLYFLHGEDGGRTVFRPNTNLPAHNRDVDEFLRGR